MTRVFGATLALALVTSCGNTADEQGTVGSVSQAAISSIIISSPANLGVTPPIATIAFHAGDIPPQWIYRCSLDDGAPVACAQPSVTFGDPQRLTAGPHTAHVEIVNNGGHVKESASVTFVVDDTAPTIAFLDTSPQVANCLSSLGEPLSGESGNVVFASSDGPSTSAVSCTLTDVSSSFSSVVSCPPRGQLGPSGFLYDAGFSGLVDGHRYTLTITSTDTAQNQATARRTWVVDASTPVVTFVSPSNEPGFAGVISAPDPNGTGLTTNAGTLVVTDAFGASNVGLSTSCTMDSAPVPCTATDYAIGSLAEGSHALVVTATDCVGNTRFNPLSFYVDRTAPSVTITNAGPYVTGSAILPISASDAGNLSNIESIECALDVDDPTDSFGPCGPFAKPEPQELPTAPGVVHFQADLILTGLSLGTHKVWSRASDHFLHVSTPMSVEFVVAAPE